jgi:hypothetical protein
MDVAGVDVEMAIGHVYFAGILALVVSGLYLLGDRCG